MADEVTLPPPEPTTVEPDAAVGRHRRTRQRRTFVLLGWGVLAAVLVAVVSTGIDVVVSNHGGGKSLRAKPGECFSRVSGSDSDLKRVPCDDPAVKWTVIGVVEHKTQQESKQNACQAWPNAEASYWETRNGTDGFVLCLGSVAAG